LLENKQKRVPLLVKYLNKNVLFSFIKNSFIHRNESLFL
jgi:hypothetical protein